MISTMVQYGVYVASISMLLHICWILFRAATSPLRDVPGPLLARFTRLWYFRSILTGQAQWDNIALHRKYAKEGQFYAPIVRLGPNMYSITRPEKTVYGIGTKMRKSSWYEGWKHPDPNRQTLFTDRNIQSHAENRRKFQSMYSMSSLLHYEKFVEPTQDLFQKHLEQMTMDGREVDMHHWLQCFAFDVIGNITYGRRFGFLDHGQDVNKMMASLEANMPYSTLVGVYSWAHSTLFGIMAMLPGSGAAGRNHLNAFVRSRIAEREVERDADEKLGKRYVPEEGLPRDFLNWAMDAERDPEKAMTKYNIFMVCISNIIAGSDTTAVSLSSVLWHLTAHPRALAKLRDELDEAVKVGKMTPSRITFKESQNLPYLQACIKEGLRVCPAVGLPLWREVPQGSGGVEVLGQSFPEGSEIGVNTWVAHYDEDIWGPDAAEYRPERWVETDPEKLKLMDNLYMPFGLGSRTCIGRHISYLEMSKIVPMIVSQFDFDLVDKSGKFKTENYWFLKPTSFCVVVKPRARDS